ncbi:MAG: hypothetical protein OCD02_05615 [Spirochaetaceae bacterium]
MKQSILWNGFEIKKGEIETSVGYVPYLFYSPEISNECVNIAIHGEGHDKEDWLCFNSVLKLGNLLKESIKTNSPFIAFDLYGHGDWEINDKHFNTADLTNHDKQLLIEKSIIGISEAIGTVLKDNKLENNPVSVTAFSIGCNVVLGLDLKDIQFKTILISPFNTKYNSSSNNILVIRGENDQLTSEADFQELVEKLPTNSIIKKYKSEHEIPVIWIDAAREFIKQ